jgi:hypothetical protein
MNQEELSDLARRNLLGVFGERDERKRAAVIKDIYAEQVRFADPEGVVIGHEALNAKAQHLLDEAPDFVFTVAGPAQIAQDLVLLAWHFGPGGAPPVVSGTDISIVENGKISQLYTLLDPPTPA